MKNLILSGDVDTKMVEHLLVQLNKVDDGAEINIRLCTYGGFTDIAFGIYDTLKLTRKQRGIKINMICIGACYSSGVIIACGADKVFATNNTNFLIHYGEETNTSGDEKKFNGMLTRKMKEVIQNKTGASKRRVTGWISKETYFTAKEAQEINLVDGVYDE